MHCSEHCGTGLMAKLGGLLLPCFALGMALALLTAPRPAQAACFICDELISLNAAQAECFAANFADLLAELERDSDRRLSVNMNACTRDAYSYATRGGILTMPDPQGAAPSGGGKTVYLLDANGARCLKSLVDGHEGSFNPTTTFDLFEDCPG